MTQISAFTNTSEYTTIENAEALLAKKAVCVSTAHKAGVIHFPDGSTSMVMFDSPEDAAAWMLVGCAVDGWLRRYYSYEETLGILLQCHAGEVMPFRAKTWTGHDAHMITSGAVLYAMAEDGFLKKFGHGYYVNV